MSSDKITILYIDGSNEGLSAFQKKFEKQYHILTASSLKESLNLLASNMIHVIICHQNVNGTSGVKLLREIMMQYPDPTRIILSESAVKEDILEAVNKSHIFAYITHTKLEKNLTSLIQEAYKRFEKIQEKKKLISKLQQTNEQLEFILQQKNIS